MSYAFQTYAYLTCAMVVLFALGLLVGWRPSSWRAIPVMICFWPVIILIAVFQAFGLRRNQKEF